MRASIIRAGKYGVTPLRFLPTPIAKWQKLRGSHAETAPYACPRRQNPRSRAAGPARARDPLAIPATRSPVLAEIAGESRRNGPACAPAPGNRRRKVDYRLSVHRCGFSCQRDRAARTRFNGQNHPVAQSSGGIPLACDGPRQPGQPIRHAQRLRYVSDNPAVASVDDNGVVAAKRPGQATVYIQATNGIYCKVRVTVA